MPANPETSVLVQMMQEMVLSMREMSQSNQRIVDMYQARDKGIAVPTTVWIDKVKTSEALQRGEESVHTNPLFVDLFPPRSSAKQPVKLKPLQVEPLRKETTVQPQVYKWDDPGLYQATWGTQPGTQPTAHPLPAQLQPQTAPPAHSPMPQQNIPIFGPFSEPVVTMHTNVYSGQDVRAEDWVPHGFHEPWT